MFQSVIRPECVPFPGSPAHWVKRSGGGDVRHLPTPTGWGPRAPFTGSAEVPPSPDKACHGGNPMRAVVLLLSFIALALIPAVPASATQPAAVADRDVAAARLPRHLLRVWRDLGCGHVHDAERPCQRGGSPHLPDHQHATYEFVGQLGTFALRIQIKETVTADPNVLTGEGDWVILSGTGAYARLQAPARSPGWSTRTPSPPSSFARSWGTRTSTEAAGYRQGCPRHPRRDLSGQDFAAVDGMAGSGS